VAYKKIIKKLDFFFRCYKCSHLLWVDKKDILKMLETDCPNCGEDAYQNWILYDEGNYSEDV